MTINTIKLELEFFEWTKAMGQQHYSLLTDGTHSTLCGKPMLGNNYAREEGITFPGGCKSPCEHCATVRRYLEGVEAHL